MMLRPHILLPVARTLLNNIRLFYFSNTPHSRAVNCPPPAFRVRFAFADSCSIVKLHIVARR